MTRQHQSSLFKSDFVFEGTVRFKNESQQLTGSQDHHPRLGDINIGKSIDAIAPR